MMNDEQRLALAKQILDQHFGLLRMGRATCATCEDIPWPCPPARLAEAVKEEVLAR